MKKSRQLLLEKKELLDVFLRHRVDSPFPGDWESIYKGTGYEFWSLKELERGDPFKNIDWKATAKTGTYYVRQYLAESYYNLMIVYDVSGSMAFGRKEWVQANIAVSLAYSAISGNNGCGMIFFSDDVEYFMPPRMGFAHFMNIVAAIAQSQPISSGGTNLNRALKKLIDGVPESLTFILSDFMYPFAAEYQFQRGAHGANKHEVKAIHVLETSEIKLPPYSRGMASLYDDEGRRQMVMDLSRGNAYADEMQHRMDDIKKRLNQAGIDSLIITPDDNFPFKITEFMGGHA
jgi:uncharacterized protein (DUF58 family)